MVSWDRICRPFKEPKNRFPACLAGTTTLYVVPARQAIMLAESIPRNQFLGSINVYKYGLCWLSTGDYMDDYIDSSSSCHEN